MTAVTQAIDKNNRTVNRVIRPNGINERIVGADQTVSPGTSTTVLQFGEVVRIVADAAGFVNFVVTPGTAASTSDTYIAANIPELFRVKADDIISISDVNGGTSITGYISVME